MAAVMIGIDPLLFKREQAATFGATHTAASIEEAAELVNDITWGTNAEKNAAALERLVLEDRFGGARLPDIDTLDLTVEKPARGRWLAPRLVEAMEAGWDGCISGTSGAFPGACLGNSTIRLLRTPKTASESRYGPSLTKMCVTRVRRFSAATSRARDQPHALGPGRSTPGSTGMRYS